MKVHTIGGLLAGCGLDRLDAHLLLEQASGLSRTRQITWPEQEVPEETAQRFLALAARRLAGEPVAYLLGVREFFGRDFRVTPDTLIPRPETEHLVEFALAHLPPAGRMLEDYVATLAALVEAKKPAGVLIGATKRGKAIAGRLAARLKATVITDVKEIKLDGGALQADKAGFALRLAPEDIGVYELRPGIIATPMTEGVRDKYTARIRDGLVPAARWGEPGDIGATILPLVAGQMRFATGSVINLDGGLAIGRL